MVKRLFQGVILFFAIYAFAFMPLGKRTALEHIQAVLGSSEAKQAATELKGGATRLVRKLRGTKEEPRRQAPQAPKPSLAPEYSSPQNPTPQRPSP